VSVLVRAPNWLGDAVMSLPALAALHTQLNGEPLVALARAAVADIYRLSGLCQEVLVLPSPKSAAGWRGIMDAARSLRRRTFRAGILFPNSLESALFLRLSGTKQRWGYARDGRGFLLTRAIAPPGKGAIPLHEAFYYLELLRRLEIIAALPGTAVPALNLSAESVARGKEILMQSGLAGDVVAISPGSANSRAKQWPPAKFVESACLVAGSLEASVAVFGTLGERPLCEEITSQIARRGVRVSNLAGSTSLADFVRALAACRLLITNDSGGMHVGYAAGVPTVAIFGPTIHQETGPVGTHTRVVREPAECSPCMLKECPIDHRCMTRVTAERVALEAFELVHLQ